MTSEGSVELDTLQLVFSDNKCVNIRIDLTRDIPVTILGKYPSLQKKDRRFNLREIIYADDFPPLADVFSEIVSGRQKSLNAHCRVHIGNDYHWAYLSCTMRKDTFNKTLHLTGTMMDVSEYLENAQDDFVLEEVKKKNSDRIQQIERNENTLADILGIDYLTKIQNSFSMTDGVFSAICDNDGNLICTADNCEDPTLKKYKFKRTEEIRFNHQTLAMWTIASNDQQLLEKNYPLLDVLVQTVSQIANAFLVLYNEMEHSKQANQQLGSNIEQQILLNNIYTIILEKKDSDEALRNVIRLVGEYLKLDRMVLYSYNTDTMETVMLKEWADRSENLGSVPNFSLADFPKLLDELNYCDTFFSYSAFTEFEKLGIKSFVVSQLSENGKFTGLIFYETIYNERIWSNSDKKLLRNVSQIISTMLIRCNMDTALKNQNERLKALAYTDPVLGISNRANLDIDLQHELEKDACGVAIAMKITNMRSVNEAFGHIHSDSLLKKIAKYIDGMEYKGKRAYRFSGSVLMVLLRGSTGEQAKEFAEALLKRFRSSWIIGGKEHYMELVAGIAPYTGENTDTEEIYRFATLSMYRAAEFGKNTYAFYTPEYERDNSTNYNIEQRLRESIFNRMEGFSIVYQPVFSSDGRTIVSYEALVRWNLPGVSSVSTRKVMKLAESTGVDVLIDTWVINNVCEFCRRMIDETGNEDLIVCVNVTTHELQRTAIHEVIKSAVEKNGLSGKNIMVEIPEKAQIKAGTDIAPVVGQLCKMNIKIVIDDYGRDFMSLASLKNSYVSLIKINSNLFTMNSEPFDTEALKSVISLAHSRGISVCVKRVEDISQYEVLRQYEIDHMQGNFAAKAMPAEETLEFTKSARSAVETA